ncbi:EF-hand domain-containing protein [Ideonella livida]|uniref:EF-hand domain-containing protein n=1 Tax=Ideonella livida TaxID=2707176 RepID=A0A7C9TK95_9BURK|nr:EF-hand domain-containing protein [Ideonella livida]NDY91165.1 hypothetical protein [Ideonella livida]
MHVSSSSGGGLAAALWSLTQSQRGASTASSATSATGATTANFAVDGETASSSSSTGAARGSPPEPPPGPPPAAWGLGQSTQGLAASGPPALGDLDSDGDGTVSGEEFGLDGADAQAQALFQAVDSDGDGSLASEEISAFEAERPQGPPPGPPPGEPPSGDSASSGDSEDALQALFDQIDSDASGQLSQSELGEFISQLQQALEQAYGGTSASASTHDGERSSALSVMA